MASISLRPAVRSRPRPDIETLAQLHATLVNERQQLRSEGARAEALEENRLAIVHCQWELSRALIERHLPAPPAPAPSPA
jgi:hypothetical protein